MGLKVGPSPPPPSPHAFAHALAQEPSKDELKRLKALVKERVSVLRQSEGLTIKKAEEKALNSLTSAERRLIETSTHGKRYVRPFSSDGWLITLHF